jgi:hypothetical protein
MRLMFFPACCCEILDTWHSIGLRGTGSHDYTVTDLFVPAARSLSFRDWDCVGRKDDDALR